jgi:integrase
MATLRQRKERWQARVQRRGFENITKSFILKSDAMQWARSVEIEIDRGTFLNNHLARKTSFADIIQRYIKEVAPQLKSFYGETYRLAKLAKHPIAQYKMAELTSARIAIYRDQRLREVSNGTVRRELSIISSIIEYARSEWNQNLASNPVSEIKKPKSSRSRNRILSDGEKERLLRALEQYNPLMKLVVEFALETAMRRGEILSLIWRNINFEKRTAYLPMTKNGEYRYVPLSTRAVNILNSLPQSENECVFKLEGQTLSIGFKRCTKRANVVDMRFHDLRHCAITNLSSKFLNVLELAAISGHKSLNMLKRYTHIKAEDLVKKLD